MSTIVQFYCVGCCRLMEAARAAVLFKTGYYRSEFALGCCVDCHAETVNGGGVPYPEAAASCGVGPVETFTFS